MTEQQAKAELLKLRQDGKIVYSIGNHGMIFMQPKGQHLKAYDTNLQALKQYKPANTMKIISGHLTAKQRRVVKELFRLNLKTGRVGRSDYWIMPDEQLNHYQVRIRLMMTQTIGAEPTPYTIISKIKL
jgi:hypothetical protein